MVRTKHLSDERPSTRLSDPILTGGIGEERDWRAGGSESRRIGEEGGGV